MVTSLFAHGALLGWAVVSVAAPKPMTVPEIEAVTAEIIPIESITRTVKGVKTAPAAEVPKPTERETTKPPRPEPRPAENVGDTDKDIATDEQQVKKAAPIQKVSAPEPRPKPRPEPKPEPKLPDPKPEPPKPEPPKPVVQTEPTVTPEPKPEPKAEPKTDIAMLLRKAQDEPATQPKPEEQPKFAKLPDRVPAPKRRPKPTPKPKEQKALVDKKEASAGGARRNTQKAALGTKRGTNATKLSTSEIDALRGQIQACWNVGALAGSDDAEKLRARVVFRLKRNGEIDGRPQAKATGGNARANRTFAGGARRAVIGCAPYRLPADKYETWSEVVVNFSLADMLDN
ncbi:MAG: hypothetical protein AAGM04_12640 [Pseudomonadota bacterium]